MIIVDDLVMTGGTLVQCAKVRANLKNYTRFSFVGLWASPLFRPGIVKGAITQYVRKYRPTSRCDA